MVASYTSAVEFIDGTHLTGLARVGRNEATLIHSSQHRPKATLDKLCKTTPVLRGARTQRLVG